MSIDNRISMIESIGEEIVTREELKDLFERKTHPVAYDGFEPSGQMHIAQGIMRSINTNKMVKAGVDFKFWVADWFAWMNNKMDGDLEKIKKVGEYQIEVWKACGMDVKNVKFLWASKEIANNKEYWKRTINIARNNTVQRIIRCSQIMGRNEKDTLTAAQIFYPCMQASDIFHLEADITNLGMDQRKVNILAREIGPKLGLWKPIVVSNHMLMGLLEPKTTNDPKNYILSSIDYEELDNGGKIRIKSIPPRESIEVRGKSNIFITFSDMFGSSRKPIPVVLEYIKPDHTKQEINITESEWKMCDDIGIRVISVNLDEIKLKADIATKKTDLERTIAMKMSKSIPESAIFMTDSKEEVRRKISKAYCPEKQVHENPIIEYMKYIIFESEKFKEIQIDRPSKFGGTVTYVKFDEMAKDFSDGALHPIDLKNATTEHINKLLDPVRKHFSKGKAKKLAEFVKSQQVTR
ncbi:hypothetical protein HYZ41_00255 [archaeon]|nr:hypothetical protein [archaeon]